MIFFSLLTIEGPVRTFFHTYPILACRLPILGWIPGYRLDAATADILAGLTVGMTVIPQVSQMVGRNDHHIAGQSKSRNDVCHRSVKLSG
jgi:hypothetical protein